MVPDGVPPDLVAAMLRAGYRLGGPAGIGSNGPAWAAVGREDGPAAGSRVVVTVLDVPPDPDGAPARARLAALRTVRHEHLAEIVDVVPVDGLALSDDGAAPAGRASGRWAVLLAEVPGPNLAALLAARPPLSEGEVVTLTVPLAQALAALHDAGLAHGDVSPANVVVRPDGRPVLVDLLGAVAVDVGAGQGRGTPGYAAPEVERGAPTGSAADVHALARVGLTALVDEAGEVRDVLEQACSPAAGERPAAAELARLCYAAAAAQPIMVPDAAVLARTTLARLAVEASTRTALTVGRSGSRHRAGGRRWAGYARVAAAVVAVAACGVVVARLTVWGPADGVDRGPATEPAAVSARPDPLAAAVALTEHRAEVLTAGAPAGLADVDLVGGGAQSADLTLLAGLSAAGQRIEGLAVSVVSARMVDRTAAPASGASRAVVEITSSVTAHRRVSTTGAATVEVPAQPARTVVLTLSWTASGWRVAEVADPPVSGSAG